MRRPVLAALFFLASAPSVAALRTESVDYRHGDVVLKGYLAYDDAVSGKRPGVLVVHEWWGLNDYARMRAEKVAALGYVAFAADIYGGGKITQEAQEAGHLAGVFLQDRALLRERARVALEFLRKHDRTDPARVAAIGYCFGGTTVLELARANADVRGVVSFHGGLKTPDPAANRPVAPSVLVLHGADDPFIPAADVAAFQEEVRAAKADWQMILLGGARHSFTNPDARGALKGALYDERADRRSWEYMKLFLEEVLR